MRRPPNFSQREGTRGSGISASPKPLKRFGTPSKKLRPKVLAGSSFEVNDQRYNATQIRARYVSELYPLSRNKHAI